MRQPLNPEQQAPKHISFGSIRHQLLFMRTQAEGEKGKKKRMNERASAIAFNKSKKEKEKKRKEKKRNMQGEERVGENEEILPRELVGKTGIRLEN